MKGKDMKHPVVATTLAMATKSSLPVEQATTLFKLLYCVGKLYLSKHNVDRRKEIELGEKYRFFN